VSLTVKIHRVSCSFLGSLLGGSSSLGWSSRSLGWSSLGSRLRSSLFSWSGGLSWCFSSGSRGSLSGLSGSNWLSFSLLRGGLGGGGSWSSSRLLRGNRGLSSGGSLALLLVSDLLLLKVLGEELLIGDVSLLGSLPCANLTSLVDSLSSDSLLGDESLDLGRFVEGLVTLLEFSADDVFGEVILASESILLSDLASSLWAESSFSLLVGKAGNFTGTLLENLKGDDTKVRSTDASSDGLSLSLTSSTRSVRLNSGLHEDSDSTVDEDTLLHGESLLVVTAGDSKGVSLEFSADDFSIDIRAHSSVVEVTVDLVVIDFLDELAPSKWVGNMVLHSGVMIASTAG